MSKLVFFASLGITLVACTADPFGDLPANPATDSASTTSPKSCSASGGAIQGADPSTLKTCTGTKGTAGRCVPTSALGSFADMIEQGSCDGGAACVPDDLVKNGSTIQLKKCTAVLNTEGRCFWPVAKDINANYDLLEGATKDQCPTGLVCAPCVNPLNKQDTGLCSLGSGGGGSSSCSAGAGDAGSPGTGTPASTGTCPQVDPILDVSSFSAEDCGSDMLCVDASLVPAAVGKMLKTCSKGLCAPKKSVERGGNYVPKTCRSLADSEGRCMNVSIPQIASQASLLPQGAGCDADERCAPCFDPRTGEDTGACHSAPCDAPKEPKKTFANCCGGQGKCVPTSVVGGNGASFLQADSCTGDTPLCAPNELVGGATPKKCSVAFGLVTGICVSACTVGGQLIGSLAQGDCTGGDMCAPCDLLPTGSCP
jgi:hypothetical protein